MPTAPEGAPPVRGTDPLIEQAQSGDTRAFERLYRMHVGSVHGLCRRLCGGDERRAEEMTQRTFIKAWSKLDQFRGGSRFSTWLHRIAVRVVIDHDRTAWWRRVRGELSPGAHTTSRADAGTRLDLERAVATLPAKARRVLVLHDVEGWRHTDIAEAMGVSVGTSKSQLSRARKLLRERLT